jgi:exopolyphosphatase / guanosine-5'-triphosphate,3'-diphosphate pyrophosphatase
MLNLYFIYLDFIMERIAIIDIGTNNFLLIIAEKFADSQGIKSNFSFKILHKSKVFAFIGRGGINQQVIAPDAFERTLNYLQDFKKTIDSFDCKEVRAIATSAIRNAKNGAELVEKVNQLTGIQIEVIDGDREADLIYKGVKSYLTIDETSLIMDIGGGSVEFIIGKGEQIFWKQSFEIGAQRLLYDFQKHDPIQKSEVQALNDFLEKTLQPLFEAITKFPLQTLIGSAGSFDTIVDIYCVQTQIPNTLKEKKEFDLPLSAYFPIHQELISKNNQARTKIEGMLADRAEMIVVASCLIHFIVKKLEISKMRVSAASLKEGVLWEWLHNI